MYTTRMASRLVGAAGVALLGLLALGCDTAKPSGPPTASQVAVSSGDCAGKIRAMDLANDATVFAVDRCRFTLEGGEAAKAVLAANVSGDALWAAIWVYVDSASDPAPLRPFVRAGTPTTRAMASAGAIAFGDSAGFDGLREALTADQQLDGSTPPIAISAFALGALERYVIVPDAPTTAADWATWLSSNGTRLGFDPSQGTWSLR